MGLQQSFIVYRINTRGSQKIRTHHFFITTNIGLQQYQKEKKSHQVGFSVRANGKEFQQPRPVKMKLSFSRATY
jgi:hypothetical protein